VCPKYRESLEMRLLTFEQAFTNFDGLGKDPGGNTLHSPSQGSNVCKAVPSGNPTVWFRFVVRSEVYAAY